MQRSVVEQPDHDSPYQNITRLAVPAPPITIPPRPPRAYVRTFFALILGLASLITLVLLAAAVVAP